MNLRVLTTSRSGVGCREAGVTLIEMMVALGLLAVILASLLAVFDGLRSLSETSSNLTVATLDAQDVMAQALRHDYEDLLNFAPPTKQNLQSQAVTVSVTDESGGSVTDPLPDIVAIGVTVTWEERGSSVSTELRTLRARGF